MTSQNKKILIVEDEIPMMKVLNKKLTEAQFTVLKSSDGQEGLEMALDEHPDLILLDVLMPRLGGIDMAKTLRRDSWGKDVPIIMLTNLSLQPEVVEELNLVEYIIKANIDLPELIALIKMQLSSE